MLKFVILSLLAISSSSGFQRYKEEAKPYLRPFPPPADPKNYNPENVNFYLYTRESPGKHQLVIDDLQTLHNSSYDVNKQTKLLIPEMLATEETLNEMVSAYLRDHKEALNVVTVDYAKYASAELEDIYQLVGKIGRTSGKLLKMLLKYGARADCVHVIGHGFGAHMAGVAGKSISPLKLGRLTGLDPIGLRYDQDATLPQLESSDAHFIDVISTSTNTIGSKKQRGVAQFYLNGGQQQPSQNNAYISHNKAHLYFTESIVHQGRAFASAAATSYVDYLNGKTIGDQTYMGEYVNKNATGSYYLRTSTLPWYAVEFDRPQSNPVPAAGTRTQTSSEESLLHRIIQAQAKRNELRQYWD